MNSAKHILIAYFSHTGQNYSNGSLVELKRGNTAVAAELAAELTGGELFEIEPVKTYPLTYRECTEVAGDELRANSRPQLVRDIDISGYDTVILGYPCWWGTMPMAVKTFLDAHDFTGKTVLPYCTHEGSGMGSSEADLKKLVPGAKVARGLAIHGSSVKGSAPAIRAWLASAKAL